MFTLGQKLAHHNMNTQHPFFTTDNNGFNMRSVGAYYFTEVEELPEYATDDAFDPEWDYFRVVDDNTIIFECETTRSYPSWTHLIKIKYENGVWSNSCAECTVNDDNEIPLHDPEPYITYTDSAWNTL